MARYALALASVLALSGCSESPGGVTAPSATAHLTATVTPSPLNAPTEAGTDLFWNLELRAGASNITVIEADVQLLDASGLIVGHTKELWSQSAGCSVCSGEWTISARSAPTFSGRRVRYVGGGRPAKFVYTLSFFAEGSGPGTTVVEVPVR